MKQTVDIVGSIIADMLVELHISNVEDLGNNKYKLTTCNTQYLNTLYVFELDGNAVKVIEFEFNSYVIVESINYIPLQNKYLLPAPRYFFGTLIEVNSEIEEIPYQDGKYPYIFLLERMTEDFNSDEESTMDRRSPLKMFFLTNYDEGNWQTKDHYKEIINPMTNIRNIFLSLLKKSKLVNDEETFNDDWRGTNYVRFGTYSENNGNIKSLMNEDVSGVGLEINVIFVKILNCKNNECM